MVSESTQPRSRQSLAMRLLEAGIPISLLVDLTAPEGPRSTEISERERPCARYAIA
jgi:hypothetical protein